MCEQKLFIFYYSHFTQSYPLICVVKSMQALDSDIFKFRQLLISHWCSDQRKSQSQIRKNRNGSDALKLQTPRSGHRRLQTSGIYNKRKILTVGTRSRWKLESFVLMNCLPSMGAHPAAEN